MTDIDTFNKRTEMEEDMRDENSPGLSGDVNNLFWRDISTAPKDGTVILAWRFYPVAIRWTGGNGWAWEAVQLGTDIPAPLFYNGFSADDKNLTHWMPLPGSPKN